MGPGAFSPGPVGGRSLAEWPRRFVATLVDQLLYLPGSILLGLGLPKSWEVDAGSTQASGTDDGNLLLALLGAALSLAVFLWNRVYKQGTTGQSVGKGVMKIRAIAEQTGQPIGMAMAFARDLISGVLSRRREPSSSTRAERTGRPGVPGTTAPPAGRWGRTARSDPFVMPVAGQPAPERRRATS